MAKNLRILGVSVGGGVKNADITAKKNNKTLDFFFSI